MPAQRTAAPGTNKAARKATRAQPAAEAEVPEALEDEGPSSSAGQGTVGQTASYGAALRDRLNALGVQADVEEI